MARPPKLTPEQLGEAAVLLRSGKSRASVARQFGITGNGLQKALDRLAAEPPRSPSSPSEPAGKQPNTSKLPPSVTDAVITLDELGDDSDEEDELPLDEAMTIEEQKKWLSRVAREARDRADQLITLGDNTEARKVLELAFKAGNTLARLSKDENNDDIRIPKDDVAEIAAGARRKVEQYLATKRPLLCAHCNHELSVRWGKGEE